MVFSERVRADAVRIEPRRTDGGRAGTLGADGAPVPADYPIVTPGSLGWLSTAVKRIAPATFPAMNRVFGRILPLITRGTNIVQGKGAGAGWDLDGEIAAALSVLAGEDLVVFDVGANCGEYAARLRDRIAPSTRIYLFEPSPFCCERLRARPLANTELVPLGLSDQAGEATLHYSGATDGTASLFERKGAFTGAQESRTVAVAVTTVDRFLAERGITRVDFMKMDTEGNELRVLKGATESLAQGRIRAFSFEFGDGQLNSRTFFADYWAMCQEYGFDVFRITPGGYLIPIKGYYEDLEYFVGATNYICRLAAR